MNNHGNEFCLTICRTIILTSLLKNSIKYQKYYTLKQMHPWMKPKIFSYFFVCFGCQIQLVTLMHCVYYWNVETFFDRFFRMKMICHFLCEELPYDSSQIMQNYSFEQQYIFWVSLTLYKRGKMCNKN